MAIEREKRTKNDQMNYSAGWLGEQASQKPRNQDVLLHVVRFQAKAKTYVRTAVKSKMMNFICHLVSATANAFTQTSYLQAH